MLSESDPSAHPGHAGLVDNIIKFSRLLRDQGVPVSFASVLDVARGLGFVDIFDREVFRSLLRMNLVFRKEDIQLFDALFEDFWSIRDQVELTARCGNETDSESSAESLDIQQERTAELFNQEDGLPEHLQEWVACYSPEAVNKACAPSDFVASEEIYGLIRKWLKPLRTHLSRRTRYAIRGRQIDLRRVLRKNMQFGGELIFLDFKKKKLKNKRILFFCDVSGSMDVFTLILLHFIHALKRIDHRTEIFLFSTELSRWTGRFEADDPWGAIARLPEFVRDWGGGTRIGHSLKRFNERYGRWMLSGKTIALIFSDGWDRGENSLLESQMAYLHSKSHRVIWLNPLMGTRNYQPICQGMSTALPYVDHFLPMGNLKDLHYLGKTLSKIIM